MQNARYCADETNYWCRCIYGAALLLATYMIIANCHNNELIETVAADVKILKARLKDTTTKILSKLEIEKNAINSNQESKWATLPRNWRQDLETYNADKTGKVDFASELVGGRIVSLTKGTESVRKPGNLFGIKLCDGSNGPSVMLQADMSPGQCWAFNSGQVWDQNDLIYQVREDVKVLSTEMKGANMKILAKLEREKNRIKGNQETKWAQLVRSFHQDLETFNADKTGKIDFASEIIGGHIVSLTKGTENVRKPGRLFGFKICHGSNGPSAMLQTEMSPGQCWAFNSGQGGAVIQLSGRVRINAVTIEHIPKAMSLTGEISSAVKDFSVRGLKNPTTESGQELGNFQYRADGPTLQTFNITNQEFFNFVEFRVTSNQGNPAYTCVYRFRVHGTLDNQQVRV